MFPSAAKHLAALYEKHGYQIRAVGGWVRDTIRGIEAKDLDLCTTALPEQSIALCKEHGLRYIETGLQHGTITIMVDDQQVEVTTLRVDAETDGRHAVVEFTTDWRADAARRDFTINAMSMCPMGNIYDYFEGKKHLCDRRVIFVGDAEDRIHEDYLRILRYFRFKGRIGDSSVDREVEHIISDTAHGLKQISVERIWSEMSRIFSDSQNSLFRGILFAMYVTGTFEHIGIPDPDIGDIDRAVMVRRATSNPVTVLAALTKRPIADRWKMSRAEIDLFRFLQTYRGAPLVMSFLKDIATSKDMGIDYAIELAAMHGPSPQLEELKNWQIPVFPVRGADIVAAGVPAGPEVGYTLKRLEHDWKRSNFELNREDLLAAL